MAQSDILRIRITPELKAKLEKAAADAHQPVSVYVRMLIVERLKAQQ